MGRPSAIVVLEGRTSVLYLASDARLDSQAYQGGSIWELCRRLVRSFDRSVPSARRRKESPVNTRIKMAQAQQRSSDRRARENDAPRLATMVPDLTELEIAIVEQSGVASSSYRKRMVVATAPALFIITCGEPRCDDGGHDITYDVLRALRERRTDQHGEHECRGQIAAGNCRRRIEYDVRAVYTPLRAPR
jgi:hypothetical protein